jgi:hypothetical protein
LQYYPLEKNSLLKNEVGMKQYLFFFALMMVLTTHQSNSMGDYPEIAINTHGKAIMDRQRIHRLFVPIMVYMNGKLVCGTFIPWKAISTADDGSVVIDTHDNLRNYFYKCDQRHASGNKTFQQALAEVTSKKSIK